MAQDIRYNVIAQMVAKGWQGMRGMARSLRPVYDNIGKIEQRITGLGQRMRGTTQDFAATMGSRAVMAGAAALPIALGGAVAYGLKFNNTMEQATLQAATMYNLFDFAAGAAEVVNGELSQWQYNLQASKAVYKELYKIAEKTPGEFEDVAMVYQNAAAGLATQTQDLRRQLDFMAKASLLGGLTHGDYKTLGSQMGRMLSGGAGAEMDTWKQLQDPILRAGQAMKIFGKDMAIGKDLTKAFNALDGDKRLQLMMKAMEKIGPEVADAWGDSMDGLLGTTKSTLKDLRAKATAPLFDQIKRGLKMMSDEKYGILGGKRGRLDAAAEQIGAKIGKAGGWLMDKVNDAVWFFSNNWEDIFQGIKNAGVVLAGAIKAAFAWGLARWIAGTATIGVGKAAKGLAMAKELAAKLKPVFERQARMTHAAIVRGAHGKRAGMLGGIGRLLGARTNRMERESRSSVSFRDRFRRGRDGKFAGGKNKGGGMVTRMTGALGADPFRNIAAFMAKFASLGMVMAGGAIAVGALIAAFGIVFTIVGGIAAYVVSNWDAIAASLVKGLQDGSITLKPLLLAAYAFWARLKMIGVWLLGSADHGEQFNTVLGWMVGAINLASGALGFFLRTMAFFLGVWYTLKLAMLGVARAILWIVDMAAMLPGGPSDDTVRNAAQNYADFSRGVDETAKSGAELMAMADKVDAFKFKDFEFAAIEKEADAMAKSLEDMLAGKGAKNDGKKVGGAKVHVDKIDMKIDLRDEDPDRMMSMFMTPIMRLAEHRTQSGMWPAGGV